MHWTKEVEKAKSTDDLYDIAIDTGRRDFHDYEMLDAKTASAMKSFSCMCTSEGELSVEEQRAQKDDRFLRGRQIAYMIYDFFRATRAYHAAQSLSVLSGTLLHNDDVQDFDTRWEQALLAASEIPSEVVLEGL